MKTTTRKPLCNRSYIERLEGKNQHSQENFIYQAKQAIWNSYDNQEIASSVLSSIISDVEIMMLQAYHLGQEHGSEVGRERGFKEALETLFKEYDNEKVESTVR